MKKVKAQLKAQLEKSERARERKNKNKLIAYNIIRDNQQLFTAHPDYVKEKVEEMVRYVLTADRAWRQVVEQNPELRGEDYDEKEELEEIKIKQLHEI